MSETSRDNRGRLLPGYKHAIVRAWSYDPEAAKLIKAACASEAMDVLPKLRELTQSPSPAVQILAMEAIFRLAYGKPTVARLVKAEVLRLTGQEHPYKTIKQWPDGALKELDSPASAAILDRGQEPEIHTYQPPLDPQAIARRQLALKQAQLDKMKLELLQAEADLVSMRNTVQIAQQELADMRARSTEPALTES
jgi:hypothetical protein